MQIKCIAVVVALLQLHWSWGAPQGLTPAVDPTPTPAVEPTPDIDPIYTPAVDPTPETEPTPAVDPLYTPAVDPTPETEQTPAVDPTPTPAVDPTPPTEPTTKHKLINGLIDIIGESIKAGNKLGTASGDLGTKITQQILDGTLNLDSMSIEALANLTRQYINILKTSANIIQGPIGKYLQKIIGAGNTGVDKLEGFSKDLTANAENVGTSVLQWINGLLHKGSDIANNIIDKGTHKIQTGIDKGLNIITGTVEG